MNYLIMINTELVGSKNANMLVFAERTARRMSTVEISRDEAWRIVREFNMEHINEVSFYRRCTEVPKVVPVDEISSLGQLKQRWSPALANMYMLTEREGNMSADWFIANIEGDQIVLEDGGGDLHEFDIAELDGWEFSINM